MCSSDLVTTTDPKTRAAGEFRRGLLVQGRYEVPGSTYEGDFVAGVQQGRGVVQYDDGNRYEGELVQGRMEGRGRYTYPNGDYYEGEMRWNTCDGTGKFVASSGTVFEGQMSANEFERGKLSVPFGAFNYSENFTNLLPLGQIGRAS